jgi:D-3-phosphoglycerate dehydrogenase
VTTTSFAEYDKTPVSLLEERGFEVVLNPFGRKLERREVPELCSGCVGIIAGTESYDRDLLKGLHGLKVISRCGSGADSIDAKAADEFGIKVLTTPGGPTLAVAELTVGLMLDLLRKVSFMDRKIRSGVWKKEMGNLLSGKSVGIIGLGRIGRKTAELLEAFGCEIVYTDPLVIEKMPRFRRVSLNELLASSDIVSLHVSGSERVIGAEELRLMKKGAWIVNVSRGGTLDEEALYRFLKDDRIAGAALDVFDKEPYKGPLSELDNVVLTPHIGSYAREARIKMERESVDNLLKRLEELIRC